MSLASAGWIDLLADARLAPSAHNTQRWLIRVVTDQEAELRYDPTRVLPVEDPEARFTSCGFQPGLFSVLATNPKAYG